MFKEHMAVVKDPHGHEQGRIVFIKIRPCKELFNLLHRTARISAVRSQSYEELNIYQTPTGRPLILAKLKKKRKTGIILSFLNLKRPNHPFISHSFLHFYRLALLSPLSHSTCTSLRLRARETETFLSLN